MNPAAVNPAAAAAAVNPAAVNPAAVNPAAAADGPVLQRLHARLVDAAEAAGELDLTYRTVDSPLGSLLVAATVAGVVRVAFEGEDHDAVLAVLAAGVGPRVLRTGRRLDPAARELEEYFAGRRRAFDVPLDLRLVSGFRRRVVEALGTIPFGERRSYGAMAAAVGSPRAVRAVGTACATNPLPLLLPCHRVVRADGTPGAYRGGAEAKAALLDLERQHPPEPSRAGSARNG